MKSITQTTPYGHTIFCDDIRTEVGGKLSFMGVYSGSINFTEPFPAELHKFAFAIIYHERPGESSDPVALSIFMPGDADDKPTISAEIPVKQMRSQTSPSEVQSDDTLVSSMMRMIVMPFKVSNEGLIKVRAYRGDLEIKLGTLRVRFEPPEVHPTASAQNPT